MPISLSLPNIIDHYQLNNKVLKDYVYMEIRKGMYGLPQAGFFANKLLKKRLAKHDTLSSPIPLASSAMNPLPYGSTLPWMTLVSNSSTRTPSTPLQFPLS
jgi:hypothetical protein